MIIQVCRRVGLSGGISDSVGFPIKNSREMEIITDKTILEDIREFEKRIQTAENKLAEIPQGYLPYYVHKKQEEQQRILLAEIAHVKKLIHIAREGLSSQI